jgi:hypothetical protein
MATIIITCPECQKSSTGPAELQGKRIRCKACSKVFVVKAAAPIKAAASPSKTAASGKTAPGPAKPAPAPKKTPPKAPSTDHREDQEGRNPYQITDVELAPRCPQCAAELESEDAVICLNCGYNNRTRVRMTTVSTYAYTPLDWIIWLTPGIACALVVLVLIGVIVFLWIPMGLKKVAGDAWWGDLYVKIYGSVFAAFGAWTAGKFAFRRLIVNFWPPEKLKRESAALR